MIARAAFGERMEGRFHSLESNHLAAEFGRAGERDCLDLATRTVPIRPQRKQLPDVLDLKSKIPRVRDES